MPLLAVIKSNKSMLLNKYYRIGVIYPSVVVVLLTIVFSIINDHNYKSEWLTAESVIFMSIITAIIYCLLISGLSLTIFLNKNRKVHTSKILTIITWFLLPFGCITIVLIHDIKHRLKYDSEFGSDFLHLLLMNVPFIFGLIWTYTKFRKNNYRQQGV